MEEDGMVEEDAVEEQEEQKSDEPVDNDVDDWTGGVTSAISSRS